MSPAFGAEAIDISNDDLIGKRLGEYGYFSGSSNASITDILEHRSTLSFQRGTAASIRLDLFNSSAAERKAVWVEYSLYNPYPEEKSVYFDAGNYTYKSVVLYRDFLLVDRLKLGEVGRDRVFKLNLLPQGKTTFHFKIDPALELGFSPYIWLEKSSFIKRISSLDTLYGMAMAVIAMSILFNLMILVTYNERSHLYYLFYLFAFFLWTWSVRFVTESPWGENDGIGVTAGMMGFSAIMFTIEFLGLKRNRFFKLSSYLIATITFLGVLYTLFEPIAGFHLLQNVSMFASLIMVSGGIFIVLRYRETHAIIYCVAYGTMLGGVTLNILYNTGTLNDPLFETGMLFGATLENILMLIAMGQKILSTEAERKHSYGQLEKLIFPHQLEHIQQGEDLETTMPVGHETACVLAFDVVGSSKLDSHQFAELWEEFMGQCRLIMTEQYDSKTLESRGYMIKEMGDGFLCSVGYPFKDPSNSISLSAVELGIRLLQIFAEVMNREPDKKPIHCSIGIVKGDVKAYFSKSGAIRHDLWGRAVVLATRYEGIRRGFFGPKKRPEGSLITVHYSVYEDLSKQLQKTFTLVDLERENYKIRDDPESRYFAYRLEGQGRNLEEAS